MDYKSSFDYLNILRQLEKQENLPKNIIPSLKGYLKPIYKSDLENQYSAPMVWIGMYIAGASLVCILAMVADLIHGLRTRKLWFPCKCFRINSAFLTVISVAMKLPVDLSGTMLGDVDKAAKRGSIAFMITMMANLLPCLATMDNNELLSNITALCVLVITLVVNVCIQIQTGAVSDFSFVSGEPDFKEYMLQLDVQSLDVDRDVMVPSLCVIMLLWLLMIHICSSVAILKSKKIIESKYQRGHDRASKDIQASPGELLTVEKLQKHVTNHWIMAGSGSPQFIITCFHTTSASGVICLIATLLHTYTIYWNFDAVLGKDYDSDYGRSMMVILIVQFIGIVIGTIAPLSRCFATLSFKVSPDIVSKHFKVFQVERYWTSKLYDWRRAGIRLPFRRNNLEAVIESLKRLILNICIRWQKGVVVVCKVIALIPFLFMICFWYFSRLLNKVLGNKFEKLQGKYNDLRPYVLKLENQRELGDKTLAGLSKSVDRLIQMATKSQPEKLMKLIIEKSTGGFEGVTKFDHEDCWRLPVVTLTTIAVSLAKVEKEEVDGLLERVREGLEYVTVVEKSLNAKDDQVCFQKAAATLWNEIRFDKSWLGNQLEDPVFQANVARQIVEWFRDKAKNIVGSEDRGKDNTGGENDDDDDDDPISKFVCANSMYRITETILLTCHTTVSQKELFDSLSSMIADIIAACLTNLPQAITTKCHTSVIEEREDSVKDAAQLLGETTEIIKTLQDRGIPRMNPSHDLPFIDKWRVCLGNP